MNLRTYNVSTIPLLTFQNFFKMPLKQSVMLYLNLGCFAFLLVIQLNKNA
jgi:hypothetical protein